MLFYYSRPVEDQGKVTDSAEQVRPAQMLQAFRDLGFDVCVVAGYVRSRKLGIATADRMMFAGVKFRFLYGESSAMPSALTNPNHLPVAPFMDTRFLGRLANCGVPIGIFYRDIYWKFPKYRARMGLLKSSIARPFFISELRAYCRVANKLYLPTRRMAKYIPCIRNECVGELPPAAAPVDAVWRPTLVRAGHLRLLYVGGVVSTYDMHELARAVSTNDRIQLTICTRAHEWAAVRHEYAEFMADNVSVVHLSGAALSKLYVAADIAVFFVQPHEYLEFAAPVKIFEYLGMGRPIIASAGTYVGDFVERNGVGWAIPYDAKVLSELLDRLCSDPEEISAKASACRRLAEQHTWRARAQQVVDDLSTIQP